VVAVQVVLALILELVESIQYLAALLLTVAVVVPTIIKMHLLEHLVQAAAVPIVVPARQVPLVKEHLVVMEPMVATQGSSHNKQVAAVAVQHPRDLLRPLAVVLLQAAQAESELHLLILDHQ
jgi:hypothetical protein